MAFIIIKEFCHVTGIGLVKSFVKVIELTVQDDPLLKPELGNKATEYQHMAIRMDIIWNEPVGL